MLQIMEKFNLITAIVFGAMYFYQIIYMLIGLKYPVSRGEKNGFHRYAIMICARNEADVIGQLIDSLKRQNYPKNLYQIFVLADNCQDETYQTALKKGAQAFRRFNSKQTGKGYALDCLYRNIVHQYGQDHFDAFLIFDADNLVDENYLREMDRMFSTDRYQVITGYRNSKNFADSWVSSASSLWFLREARFLNGARMKLNTTCTVSGTGFLVSSQLMKNNGGWPYHLLTEDVEFSVDCCNRDIMIGYCSEAVVYDEQPSSFQQAWIQRKRWARGFFQINRHYTLAQLKSFSKGRFLGKYDVLMITAPFSILLLVSFMLSMLTLCVSLVQSDATMMEMAGRFITGMLKIAGGYYLQLLLIGILTCISEWDRIRAKWYEKIIYLPMFPLFQFSYLAVSLAALFSNVTWLPIIHHSCNSKEILNYERNR